MIVWEEIYAKKKLHYTMNTQKTTESKTTLEKEKYRLARTRVWKSTEKNTQNFIYFWDTIHIFIYKDDKGWEQTTYIHNTDKFSKN